MTDVTEIKRRHFLLGKFSTGSLPESRPVAEIARTCFAFQGIACMSCRDACTAGAVRFDLALGGARPRIITDACTGCGDCAQACPAGAIAVKDPEVVS